ncbi:Signal transduction histidine kinase [Nonomuraea maritima]|uniref:histidine kinase n=1 Tax=Nonomuraea maritima TaxID=683260 RepID=A0A1G9NAX0_9ACTN|nr:sensor histidine kinase [Nonomuraea maritima]SDL83471.1 Signal transduction histidine kinase [Nonomuraea maritima]
MRSVRGWRPLALDGALAAAVFVLLGVTVSAVPGAVVLDAAAAFIGSAALVAWRRAPLVAVLVTTPCMLVLAVHLQPGPTAAFPVLLSVFAAARAGHLLIPALAGVAFLGGTLAVNLAAPAPGQSVQEITQDSTLLLGWFVAATVAGTVSRHRQAYLEQVEQRALEAERTREEVARRRAGEERLRIARELHDSLTHSISIIKVQAGVAVHLARKRGDEVPAALLAIQEAGSDAMRELRATLEILRDPDQDDDQDTDPVLDQDTGPGTGRDTEPGSGQGTARDIEPGSGQGTEPLTGPRASGLDRLGDLVDRARSTGLPATVTVSGERRTLPAAVDRAAYRIVQEALTNVTRHAGRAAASVRIDYAGTELVVQVDDDGLATPDAPPVPGVGLTGMRERVTALGGRLRAEPRPGGGFTVRAELPLGDPS